jgi:hypothetical protein
MMNSIAALRIAAEYARVIDEEAASHDGCLDAFRMSIHYCPTGLIVRY